MTKSSIYFANLHKIGELYASFYKKVETTAIHSLSDNHALRIF